jgi:hypothetical protein
MEQTTVGRPGWGGRVVFFLVMPTAPRMHHGDLVARAPGGGENGGRTRIAQGDGPRRANVVAHELRVLQPQALIDVRRKIRNDRDFALELARANGEDE